MIRHNVISWECYISVGFDRMNRVISFQIIEFVKWMYGASGFHPPLTLILVAVISFLDDGEWTVANFQPSL